MSRDHGPRSIRIIKPRASNSLDQAFRVPLTAQRRRSCCASWDMEPQIFRHGPESPSAPACTATVLDPPRRSFAPEGFQFCPRRPEHGAGLLALFNEPQFLERASTRGPLADASDLNAWLDRNRGRAKVRNGRAIACAACRLRRSLCPWRPPRSLRLPDARRPRERAAPRRGIDADGAYADDGEVARQSAPRSAHGLYRQCPRHPSLSRLRLSVRGPAPVVRPPGNGYVDAYSMAVIFGDEPRSGATPRRRQTRARVPEAAPASAMTARRRPLGTGAHVLEFRLQHRGARRARTPRRPCQPGVPRR